MSVDSKSNSKTKAKSKKSETEYDPSLYKHKKPIEHIRDVPDTYVGSAKPIPRMCSIYNFTENKISPKVIETPVAFERLFVEAFSNAIDNNTRSKNRNINPGEIEVYISDNSISVSNGGIVIPLSKTEFFVDNTDVPVNCYVAEMIFGHLLTGSNYTSEREGNGRNGYGVKLVNIFSSHFKVKITYEDKSTIYEQEWENGMITRHEPYISTSAKPVKNSVSISYIPDFERFEKKNINLDDLGVLVKHIYDGALTTRDPITLKINHPQVNGGNLLTVNLKDYTIKEYTALRYSEIQANTAIYMKGTAKLKKAESKNSKVKYELAVIDNPNIGEKLKDSIVDHTVFVNGIHTYRGGVHLDACLEELFPAMIQATGLNEENDKRSRIKITPVNMRTHVSVILSVYVSSPEFSSQLKDSLTSPEMTFKFDFKDFMDIRRWLMMDVLKEVINSKNMSVLQKSDGKRRGRIDLPVDAYYAGSKTGKKQPTILFGVEGQSAGQFITALIDQLPGKADYHGCFHFRGKPINAYSCRIERLAANKEYQRLKEALGLKEGLDYNDEENRKTLRYDHFVITPDADLDGKHITMLILGMIIKRWPSLLKIGYISLLRTPVVRVTQSSNKKTTNFFSSEEFDKWRDEIMKKQEREDAKRKTSGKIKNKDNNESDAESGEDAEGDTDSIGGRKNIRGYVIKYCKGLGSSSKAEIKADYKNNNPRYISFLYDDTDPEHKDARSIRLALHPEETNARKRWIADWIKKTDLIIEELEELPISLFINEDFIQFSIANVIRCIPSSLDGLKPSQRKVLYGLMLNYKPSKPKTMVEFEIDEKKKEHIKFSGNVVKNTKKTIKTDALSTYVAHHTNYHHGSVILQSVICMMGAEFTGSNNIPYLIPDSMMGSRRGGGKDMAASRYTSSYPHPILNYIFKQADMDLTGYTCDDDKKGEFNRSLPIIPMHVINGVNGIGTGVSTFIPNHHPLEIVNWLRQRNAKEMGKDYYMPIINPWYAGFIGNIYMVKRMPARKDKPKKQIPKHLLEGRLRKKNGISKPRDEDTDSDNESENDGENIIPESKVEVKEGLGLGEEQKELEEKELEDSSNQIVEPEQDENDMDAHVVDINSEDDDILEQQLNLEDTGYLHPEETLPAKCRLSMVSTGVYYKKPNGDVQIEELPIGLWGNKYKTILENLRLDRKIKNYKDQDTDCGIKWLLLEAEKSIIGRKQLHLTRGYTMNNMVLLDENNRPKKYNTIYEILEDYYVTRLGYYKKRKNAVLEQMKNEMAELSEYIRFLELYISDSIVFKVGNKPLKVAEIYAQLDKHRLDHKFYDKGQIRHFNQEKIVELKASYADIKSKINRLNDYHVCNIWNDELMEFEDAYTAMFKDKYDISVRKYDKRPKMACPPGTVGSVQLEKIQKRREERKIAKNRQNEKKD
jgi:DNA gyrase/topoisomerase IV subunit B